MFERTVVRRDNERQARGDLIRRGRNGLGLFGRRGDGGRGLGNDWGREKRERDDATQFGKAKAEALQVQVKIAYYQQIHEMKSWPVVGSYVPQSCLQIQMSSCRPM